MSSHRDGALSETWVRRKCGLALCPRCATWFAPLFHYAEVWCPACAPEAERDLRAARSCERPHEPAER